MIAITSRLGRASAMALATVLTLSACGGGGDANADDGAGGVVDLVVGMSSTTTAQAPLFVAQMNGYFEEEGLEVEIQLAPATLAQSLASGDVDLTASSPTSAFALTQQGKPTKILYEMVAGGAAAFVVGQPGKPDFADCKRLGTNLETTIGYAWALWFSENAGVETDLVPFSDGAARSAALASGSIDCFQGGAVSGGSQVVAGTAEWVIRPDQPETVPAGYPSEVIESVLYGTEERLDELSDSLPGFVRAINKAVEWIDEASDEEVVDLLLTHEHYSGFTREALLTALAFDRPFMTPTDGFISEEHWNTSLEFYAAGGIEGTDDEALSYASQVDMGPLEEATD